MSSEKKRAVAKKRFLNKTQDETYDRVIDSQSIEDPVQEIDWKKKYETAQMIMEASTAKLISVQKKLSAAEAKIKELEQAAEDNRLEGHFDDE